MSGSGQRTAKIVIIGGGIAGLSAAEALNQQGFTNVTLLEARERLGGRVFSMPYGDSYIEIGAQWVHGQEGNVIYALGKEHNLVVDEEPYYFRSHNWHQLKSPEVITAVEQTIATLRNILDECSEYSRDQLRSASSSLGAFLRDKFENTILNTNDTHSVRQAKEAAFDWFLRLQNEIVGCDTIYDASLYYVNEYQECDGNNLVELRHGYSRVVELVASNVPADWIRTSKVVTRIEWQQVDTGSSPIRSHAINVSCSDGEKIEADHVIVTIPLGCLKSCAKEMFTPPLPSEKLKAIESIGFGTVNKIYLEYEKPFWEPDELFFPLWMDGKNYMDNEISDTDQTVWTCSNKLKESWFRYIGRLAFVRHQPNILSVWLSGKAAEYIEVLSDEEIIDGCSKVLGMILGRDDMPSPIKVVKSSWHNDPYSQGSYSYISVACDKTGSLPSDLAEPISLSQHDGDKKYPLILFAGEATHSCYYSTVHGAYASGRREAERLANFYGKVSPRVIIVGAGAAGLAAAQKLTQNGFMNLLILEAQDRIGGRICTMSHGKSILELGAQWIHGEDGNPLYTFAKEHHLLSEPVCARSVEGDGQFCTCDGELLDHDLVKETLMVLDTIKEELCDEKHFASWKQENPDMTVEKVFKKHFEEYLRKQPYSEKQLAILRGLYRWYIRFETIDNGCPTLDDASIKTYSEYVECLGIPLINLQDGYQSVISTLLSDIPDKDRIIKTNKPVKCIRWRDVQPITKEFTKCIDYPHLIKVECEDGESFFAHHVVITTSLGFLKSHMDTLFVPSLPDPTRLAIQHLGFGTINKIYLEFREPFWKEHELGFQLIWTDESDECNANSYPRWARSFSGFDIVRDQPNMLVGWIGGHGAEEIESIPSNQVAEICTRMLRQFLPSYNVPFPVNIYRSSWYTNPYVCGAYSYISLNFEKAGMTISSAFQPITEEVTSNMETLQWPLLLFAGEATDQEFYSTVHGALRSGWREANKLISFWKQLISSH